MCFFVLLYHYVIELIEDWKIIKWHKIVLEQIDCFVLRYFEFQLLEFSNQLKWVCQSHQINQSFLVKSYYLERKWVCLLLLIYFCLLSRIFVIDQQVVCSFIFIDFISLIPHLEIFFTCLLYWANWDVGFGS